MTLDCLLLLTGWSASGGRQLTAQHHILPSQSGKTEPKHTRREQRFTRTAAGAGRYSRYKQGSSRRTLITKHTKIVCTHLRAQYSANVSIVDSDRFVQVTPPALHVYPVEEASQVFAMLDNCQITGRAVLEIAHQVNQQVTLNDNRPTRILEKH